MVDLSIVFCKCLPGRVIPNKPWSLSLFLASGPSHLRFKLRRFHPPKCDSNIQNALFLTQVVSISVDIFTWKTKPSAKPLKKFGATDPDSGFWLGSQHSAPSIRYHWSSMWHWARGFRRNHRCWNMFRRTPLMYPIQPICMLCGNASNQKIWCYVLILEMSNWFLFKCSSTRYTSGCSPKNERQIGLVSSGDDATTSDIISVGCLNR